MANVVAKIIKFLPQAVDTVFAAESKTDTLKKGGKYVNVNFEKAGYVEIFSILTDGLSDYYRSNEDQTADSYSSYNNGSGDGYEVGSVDGKWEISKLQYDRGKQFRIDAATDEEVDGAVMGSTLTDFLRTKVVPEVDATRFSRIAEKCSVTLGNKITESDLTADNILERFHKAFEWLTEQEVPDEDQILYVNPSVMTLIKNSKTLVKYLTQDEYRRADVTFKITKFEGREIIEVPSSRFFTDIIVGKGFRPSANSKVINYMVVSRQAIVPIVKIEKTKIFTPDVVQDYDGYKINFRIFHDLIIPMNKIIGAYTSVSNVAATTKSAVLQIALAEGKTTNGYVVQGVYTKPAGIRGKLVFKATAITLGAKTSGTTDIAFDPSVKGGVEIIDSTNTKGYFALLAPDTTALAVSTEITLPKKS